MITAVIVIQWTDTMNINPITNWRIQNYTSFDNSNASKVGVDNNDALAKKVYKINPKDTYISINNNSINTIDRSKEVVGTIDIVDTLGTGNNLF